MTAEDGKEEEKIESFEDVLDQVGTTGSYNVLVIVFCAAVALMTPMQVLSAEFLGKTPPHWCQVEELLAANWTPQQIREFASPNNESCMVLDYNYTVAAALGYEEAMQNPWEVPGGTGNRTCAKRFFEEGVHSIVTEWDLVCDRLVWYSTTVAASQLGLLLGSVLWGYLLDRIGRRTGMIICIFMFVPCGLLSAASVNIYMYTVVRIFVTMFGFGMYLGGFVLSMELCTPARRSLVSSYYVLPWAFGYMATAVIAYFIRYWRYLQLAYTLPATLLFANYFIVPESPRWLLLRGRYVDALEVLKKMAAKNNRELPSDERMLETLKRISPPAPQTDEKSTLSAWWQRWIVPQFQWKTPVVFFCWLSVSMVYYGVSQGASTLGVNEYVFIFVGGALEVVSYLCIFPGVKYIGRRNCVVITFFVAAISIFGVMGMQLTGYSGDNAGIAVLSYTGKFMITATFHVIYIMTGELFATSLRSLMIGESSVAARVGSISSPYINVLMGANINWAPSAFFGAFSLAAGALAMLLPETKDLSLDDGNKELVVYSITTGGDQKEHTEDTWLKQSQAYRRTKTDTVGATNPTFELEKKSNSKNLKY